MKSLPSIVLALVAASSVTAFPGALTKRVNLGNCANPAIDFGAGFDGRKENSFQPVDKDTFTNGSAQRIGVISQFVCDRLNDKCKAGADALAACAQGQKASAAVTGQAAADAFNSALGVGTVANPANTAPAAVDPNAAPTPVVDVGTNNSTNIGVSQASGVAQASDGAAATVAGRQKKKKGKEGGKKNKKAGNKKKKLAAAAAAAAAAANNGTALDGAGAALAIGKQGADQKVAQKPTGCEDAAQNKTVAGGQKVAVAGAVAVRAFAAISALDDVTVDIASALDARDPKKGKEGRKGKKSKGKEEKKAVAKVATREDTTDDIDDTADTLDRREPKKGMKGKKGKKRKKGKKGKEKAAGKTA